jgi:hypothetical protein
LPGTWSRRRLLVGGAIIGTAASTGGGLWLSHANANAALLDYFQRALPGVSIDENSALKCINDFMEWWANPPMLIRPSRYALMAKKVKMQVLAAAWQVIGVDRMAKLDGKCELVARQALTFFLVNSNFFHTENPRQEPIVYVASAPGSACANPFADLDPP